MSTGSGVLSAFHSRREITNDNQCLPLVAWPYYPQHSVPIVRSIATAELMFAAMFAGLQRLSLDTAPDEKIAVAIW